MGATNGKNGNHRKSFALSGAAMLAVATASLAEAKVIDREYRSSRLLFAGDAGVARVRGFDGIFYNPAAVADTKGLVNEIGVVSPQVTLATETKGLYTLKAGNQGVLDIVDKVRNKPQHASLQNFTGVAFRRFSFGFLQGASADALINNDPLNGFPQIEATSIARAGVYMGFSRAFMGDSLMLGVNLKLVHKVVAHAKINALDAQSGLKGEGAQELMRDALRRGTGAGADIGMLWRNADAQARPTLGVTVHNIGMNYTDSFAQNFRQPVKEPSTIDVGVSIEPGTKKSSCTLALDLKDATNKNRENIYKRVHAGAEISFQDVVGVMGGLNQGYPTYGAFVNMRLARIEAGIFTEEAGDLPGDLPSKRYQVRATIGWTPR